MKELDLIGEAKAQQHLLQSAIDLAEIGTWSYDLKKHQSTLSLRTQLWYGLPLHTNYEEIKKRIVPEHRDLAETAFRRAISSDQHKHYEISYDILNPSSGIRRSLQVLGQCQFNDQGDAVRIIGAIRDVTSERNIQLSLKQEVSKKTDELSKSLADLASANRLLEVSNNNLRQSNEELSQYAFIASHDLQEPLRKIRLYSSLLAKSAHRTAGDTELLEKIENSTTRMSLMIRDLLTYSSISKTEQSLSMIDLNELLAVVVESCRGAMQREGAEMFVGPLPTLEGDAEQLRRLFSNLLDNALKFRKADVAPVISIQLVENKSFQSDAPAIYDIAFSDNGIGMEKQYREQIFEIFQRLHNRQNYEGSGIGLAICQRIARNHQGEIFVDSVPGEGSVFHVVLPGRQ